VRRSTGCSRGCAGRWPPSWADHGRYAAPVIAIRPWEVLGCLCVVAVIAIVAVVIILVVRNNNKNDPPRPNP
jgi:hypothetical protein